VLHQNLTISFNVETIFVSKTTKIAVRILYHQKCITFKFYCDAHCCQVAVVFQFCAIRQTHRWKENSTCFVWGSWHTSEQWRLMCFWGSKLWSQFVIRIRTRQLQTSESWHRVVCCFMLITFSLIDPLLVDGSGTLNMNDLSPSSLTPGISENLYLMLAVTVIHNHTPSEY